MSDGSNEALADLVGQKVKVWSGESWTDEGVLEVYDHPWLRIRTAEGEILCFSAHAVRLVKGLERVRHDGHIAPV